MNKALKAHWLWRFTRDGETTLWKNMGLIVLVGAKKVLVLMRWFARNRSFKPIQFCSAFLGKNGSRILFWLAVVVNLSRFNFPDLFWMTHLKEIVVQEVGS